MKNMSRRKETILVIIGTLIIALIAIGISYAFYSPEIGAGSETPIIVDSYTLDNYTFSVGSPIRINANSTNFSVVGSNLSGTTTASINLVSNETGSTTGNYYLYFNIASNDFVYTDGTTPELILTVTKPDGTNLTSIPGLNYVTSGGVTGFDVTTKTGNIVVADNYPITSTNTTSGITQTWQLTITFVALSGNQDANENKRFNADVKIQKEKNDIIVDIDPNMVPIMYKTICPVVSSADETGGCWVKADLSNTIADYKWYDYDNHQWANAVTLTSAKVNEYVDALVGTPVLYNDIMGYFVYIPRYAYKLFNVNEDGNTYVSEQEILVNFENSQVSKSNGTCNGAYSTPTNGCYYTHPAFTFGDEELNGIWVGKFETSYATKLTSSIGSTSALTDGVTIKPSINTNTMYSLTYVGIFNFALIGFQIGTGNNGEYVNSNHNLIALESSVLKNTEWGAIAYLTESIYGTCTGSRGNANCTIQPQNNGGYEQQPGCGPHADGDTSVVNEPCNYYYTTLGKLSSTTQNIYGVYDMAGGTAEYVLGAGDDITSVANNVGLDNKYFDTYYYGIDVNDYSTGKLGDATKEIVKSSGQSWYNNYIEFISSNNPAFVRGGTNTISSSVGVLDFAAYNGNSLSLITTRLVLR